jgi:hypothetical protein
MTAERDAALAEKALETARIVAIKALVQKAIDVAPRNTATRVMEPLREAIKK